MASSDHWREPLKHRQHVITHSSGLLEQSATRHQAESGRIDPEFNAKPHEEIDLLNVVYET